MSAASYEFQRARKLNRLAHAEGKQELRCELRRATGTSMRHKWQSSGALGNDEQFLGDSNARAVLRFGRLKKSYATMRKSFRLQVATGQSEQQQGQENFAVEPDERSTGDSSKRSLIGQLGFGAARLLRGVYAKGRRANQHLELNSIQSTDGSFKVLSTLAHYVEFGGTQAQITSCCNVGSGGQVSIAQGAANAECGPIMSTSAKVARKSELELEIEQRLQRSKRRVLPSASYKAPDSDKACEGLNMDELEEIKRDNLRLRLRSSKAPSTNTTTATACTSTAGKTKYADQANQETHQTKSADGGANCSTKAQTPGQQQQREFNEISGCEREQAICSCKRLDCDEQQQRVPSGLESRKRNDNEHHYCSCASISASLLSSCESISEKAAQRQQLRDEGASRCQELRCLAPCSPPTLGTRRLVAVAGCGSLKLAALNHRQTLGEQAGKVQGQPKRTSESPSSIAGQLQAARQTEQARALAATDQQQQEEQQSRASDGFVGDDERIEDKLRKMFDSMGEFGFKVGNSECEPALKSVCNVSKGVPRELSANCCCCATTTTTTATKQGTLNFYQEPREREPAPARATACELSLVHATAASVQADDKNEEQAAHNCCSTLGGATSLGQHQQQASCQCGGSMQTNRRKCEQATAAPLATPSITTTRASGGGNAIELDTGQQEQQQKQLACSTSGDGADISKLGGDSSESNAEHRQQQQRRHRTLTDKIRLFAENDNGERTLVSGCRWRLANQYDAIDELCHDAIDAIGSEREKNEKNLVASSEQGREDDEQGRNATLRLISRRRERDDMMLAESELGWRVGQLERHNSRDNRTGDLYLARETSASRAGAEEHLYASIRGSQTPSPTERTQHLLARPTSLASKEMMRESEFYQQERGWQQQEFNYEFEQRKLFEKQLNSSGGHLSARHYDYEEVRLCNHQKQIYQANLDSNLSGQLQKQRQQQQAASNVKGRSKRSLLGRLKQLLVPTTSISHRAPTKRNQVEADWPLPLNFKLSSSSRSRWQKSATLTSRSTQNLLGSSIRQYLSASRKSVNLLGLEAEEERAYARKSLVSGFLTLGRRSQANSSAATGGGGKHELPISEIFKGQHRRQFGSADSLPSADSGLSCSNLQNSSSCDENYNTANIRTSSNLYSRVLPANDERNSKVDRSCRRPAPESGSGAGAIETLESRQQPIVGRARAKVDCNPCAYDKEALVFKQGDIIDILERHQSGTWIGRRGTQVGHFKFINVSEISVSNGDDEEQDDDDGSHTCKTRGDKSPNGTFVTKLEIRSNHEQQQQQSFQPIRAGRHDNDYELALKSTGGNSNTPVDKRSLSAGIGGQQQRQQEAEECDHHHHHHDRHRYHHGQQEATSEKPVVGQPLGNSNETIMSSLEQLLFAIGLAGEQANGRKQQSANDNKEMSNEQKSCCSYLDVLNTGGINNLDSFSAIDDSHELEQIGIVDDEHRRRLLMAARIIRQASRAAKLDFVQNYRIRSTADGCAPSTDDKAQMNNSGGRDSREPSRAAVVKGATSNLNEPIYVNLVDVRSAEGAALIVKNKRERAHDLDPVTAFAREQQHQRVRRHELTYQSNPAHLSGTSGVPEAADWQRKQQHYQIESHRASGKPICGQSDRLSREMSSINQPDHYHLRRCLSTQQSLGGQEIQSSASVLASTECDAYEVGRRIQGMQIHSKNSFTNLIGAVNNNNDYVDDNIDDDNNDDDDEVGNNRLEQSQLTRGYSVKLNHNHNNNNGSSSSTRHSTFEEFSQTHDLNQCDRCHKTEGRSQHQQKDMMNLRSQISSTSAYDLRLDLSHFFS